MSTVGIDHYLRGLDALERAAWGEALGAFDRAVAAADENPEYHIARGVALTFAQKMEMAAPEFERALNLGCDRNTGRMWLAAVTAMQGDFSKAADIYPEATRDLYESNVRAMARLYGELTFSEASFKREIQRDPELAGRNWSVNSRRPQPLRGSATPTDPASKRELAITQFPALARAFVERTQSRSPALATTLLDRADKRAARNDYAGALKDIERVQHVRPDDPAVLRLEATCRVNSGSLEPARSLATRLLTAKPREAPLYLVRAHALARMGSTPHARDDLAVFRKLVPGSGDIIAGVEKEIGRIPAAPTRDSIPAMVEKLAQAARRSPNSTELIAQAERVVLAANHYRLRSDDRYQRRLRELEDAVSAKPKDPDAWAALGRFRYEEAITSFGEAVEPRATFRAFRPRADVERQTEMQQAIESCDRALALRADHVPALACKAAAKMYLGQWADAQNLLRKALDTKPDDPAALELLSRVLDHAAMVKAAKAVDLRAVQSWTGIAHIFYRWPSQAELDQAERLDAEADRLWEQARAALEKAAASHRGKFDGFVAEGLLAARRKDWAAMASAYEQAAKLRPDSVSAHQQLSIAYARLRQIEPTQHQQAIAMNLVHTTAAPMLTLAWHQVQRTAWQSAQRAVDAAMAADPADPRCAAYRGVIAELQGRKDEAVGWLLAAAALDEVHAVTRGTTLRDAEGIPVSAEESSRHIALGIRAGQLLAELGRHDEALRCFAWAGVIEPRIPQGELYVPAASAMLPGVLKTPNEVPQADNPVTLLAWDHLGIGQSYATLGKSGQALEEFGRVRHYEAVAPPTRDPTPRLRSPVTHATIALARAMIAAGQLEEARHILTSYGRPWGLDPALEKELLALGEEVRKARVNQLIGEDPRPTDPRQRTPAQPVRPPRERTYERPPIRGR